MIAKQIKGTGFRGLVAYNQKKVRQGEAILLETNLAGRSVNLLAKEFNSIARLRPNLSKCVYHVSLNLPSSENIADVVFTELAQDYLLGMGFNDNQYLIYRHFDCEHHHIHIVTNRVRFDGTVVSDSQDFKRSERLVRKLELDYGLNPLVHSSVSKKITDHQKNTNSFKSDLRRELRNILRTKPTLTSFLVELEKRNIQVLFNQSPNTGYVSGIRFRYESQNVKGSELGKGFGWKAISSKLRYEPQQDAAAIATNNNRVSAFFTEALVSNTRSKAAVAIPHSRQSFLEDVLLTTNSIDSIEEPTQQKPKRKKGRQYRRKR